MANPWGKSDADYRNRHLFDIARALERIETAMHRQTAHVQLLTQALERCTTSLVDAQATRPNRPAVGAKKA